MDPKEFKKYMEECNKTEEISIQIGQELKYIKNNYPMECINMIVCSFVEIGGRMFNIFFKDNIDNEGNITIFKVSELTLKEYEQMINEIKDHEPPSIPKEYLS